MDFVQCALRGGRLVCMRTPYHSCNVVIREKKKQAHEKYFVKKEKKTFSLISIEKGHVLKVHDNPDELFPFCSFVVVCIIGSLSPCS